MWLLVLIDYHHNLCSYSSHSCFLVKHPVFVRDNFFVTHFPWHLVKTSTGGGEGVPVMEFHLVASLKAVSFFAKCFICEATNDTSSNVFICKTVLGPGAKSWMFGAPTTTGTAPAFTNHRQSYIQQEGIYFQSTISTKQWLCQKQG